MIHYAAMGGRPSFCEILTTRVHSAWGRGSLRAHPIITIRVHSARDRCSAPSHPKIILKVHSRSMMIHLERESIFKFIPTSSSLTHFHTMIGIRCDESNVTSKHRWWLYDVMDKTSKIKADHGSAMKRENENGRWKAHFHAIRSIQVYSAYGSR